MHDAFGRELRVGDRVMVPMTVTQITATADYCNVSLDTVATMPPKHSGPTTLSAINTQQILRANEGDDLEYRTLREKPDIVKLTPFKRHFTYGDAGNV